MTPLRCLAAACLLALATPAAAQEFADAAPPGPGEGALAALDRALPRAAGASVEAGVTRWLGLSSLETRVLAIALPAGAGEGALGLATTGEPEVGWNAAALALGAAGPTGGAAVRTCARRDRAAGALAARGLEAGAGYEAGAGAWLAMGPSMVVWAAAPQMWTRGIAPPLPRPLEFGLRARLGRAAIAWAVLRSPVREDDGERAAGVGWCGPGALAWLEARDAPLRAGLGVRFTRRHLVIACRVDEHPLLGPTTRLTIGAGRGPGAPP